MNGILIISALKSMCKVTFVKDDGKCAAFAKKIQERLGFKLKLLQCEDSPHEWIAKFSFDRSDMEGNYYVTITYNTKDESFACMLIKMKGEFFLSKIFLQCIYTI